MSIRRSAPTVEPNVAQLKKELSELKEASIAADIASSIAAQSVEAAGASPSFDSLSNTEKSAASLGVHPDAWRPIGFVNNAHYDQLLKGNSLDEDLARRIEVCY